jgi:hypothetical protein
MVTAGTKVTGKGATRQKAAGSLKEMVNKRHRQVNQELQKKQTTTTRRLTTGSTRWPWEGEVSN